MRDTYNRTKDSKKLLFNKIIIKTNQKNVNLNFSESLIDVVALWMGMECVCMFNKFEILVRFEAWNFDGCGKYVSLLK